MKKAITLVVAVISLAVIAYLLQQTSSQQPEIINGPVVDESPDIPADMSPFSDIRPDKAVLDVTVHTVEELEVLLERAEKLAVTPRPRSEEASIVLVLHGPEVEFFSIRNYEKYKGVVDQAARLDAFDVVDVRICQTMMRKFGIEPDDIPSFVEQVSFGPAEVERLTDQGYIYF